MASSREEVRSDLEQTLLSKIDESVLVCVICRDRFTSPKILPCLHSFCEQCLDTWVQTNDSNLICPTCKQSWTLPSGGVRSITNNRFVNDLLEIVEEISETVPSRTRCEGCKNEAKFWCKDCGQFFCDECVKSHKVVRSLKGHTLITMEIYNAEKDSHNFGALRPRFCDDHEDNKLEYYCETCKIPVCIKCTVIEHVAPIHKIVSIENAVETVIPYVRKYITHMKQRTTEIVQLKSETTVRATNFKSNRNAVQKQIKGRIAKLQDALVEEQARLLQEVKDIYQPKCKERDIHLENLEHEWASAECKYVYLDQLLTHGGPVDILLAKKELDQVQGAEPLHCHPDSTTRIIFEESGDNIHVVAGHVISESKVTVPQNRKRSTLYTTHGRGTDGHEKPNAIPFDHHTIQFESISQAMGVAKGNFSPGPFANAAISPIPVDIDVYMFMKHTQGRRL